MKCRSRTMDRQHPSGMGGEADLKKWTQRLPLLPLCATGFLVGFFCYLIVGQGAGLLAPERLKEMGGQVLSAKTLLPYVAWNRGKWILGLGILATTYLAPVACGGTAVWMGCSFGAFVCAAFSQYGIRAILLIFACLFPQWLVYGPGFYFWVEWCTEIYQIIGGRRLLHKKNCLIRMLFCLFLLGLGIFMECFWNPFLLQGILSGF